MPDIQPPVFDVQRDTEEKVICAILADGTALDRVSSFLRVSAFVHVMHRTFYSAMLAIAARGAEIDRIALVEELGRGHDVYVALANLPVGDATPWNVEYHAGLLRDWDLERRARSAAEEAAKAPGSAREILALLQSALDEFSGASTLPEARPAREAPPVVPPEWTIDGFLPAGEIGLGVGDGGSFKSTAWAHMLAAVAGGYRAFGRYATTQGPSLYVSAEDSEGIIKMRLEAFAEGHGWDKEVVLSNVHILASSDISLADPVWRAHVMRQAKKVRAKAIVLDPLSDLYGGDENSNTEMRVFVAYLRKLARETGAAVVVVHHAGKAGPERRQLDRIRGASALASAARAIFFFEYGDKGVTVTNLKQSRGHRLDTFVLERQIEFEQGNPGAWWSAKLSLATTQQAALNRGEAYVLAYLKTGGEHVTTGTLRTAAVGRGVTASDINDALKSLQSAGKIYYRDGGRNRRFWTLPGFPNPPFEPVHEDGENSSIDPKSSLFKPAKQAQGNSASLFKPVQVCLAGSNGSGEPAETCPPSLFTLKGEQTGSGLDDDRSSAVRSPNDDGPPAHSDEDYDPDDFEVEL